MNPLNKKRIIEHQVVKKYMIPFRDACIQNKKMVEPFSFKKGYR